jgi:hypothetical protein
LASESFEICRSKAFLAAIRLWTGDEVEELVERFDDRFMRPANDNFDFAASLEAGYVGGIIVDDGLRWSWWVEDFRPFAASLMEDLTLLALPVLYPELFRLTTAAAATVEAAACTGGTGFGGRFKVVSSAAWRFFTEAMISLANLSNSSDWS